MCARAYTPACTHMGLQKLHKLQRGPDRTKNPYTGHPKNLLEAENAIVVAAIQPYSCPPGLACTPIHTPIHTHTHIDTQRHAPPHPATQTLAYAHMRARARARVCVCVRKYVYIRMCACITSSGGLRVYACMCTHTCPHNDVCVRTCTHTHTIH